MKVIIFAVLLACALAAPIEEGVDISPSDNVNVIVNGVSEGEALRIAHLLDIELNEKQHGHVATSNVLQPLTAAAIAEAAAAAVVADAVQVAEYNTIEAVMVAEYNAADDILVAESNTIPEAVSLPAPAIPEVVLPEGIALPEPATPEVIIPELPAGIVLPSPAVPEVVEPEIPAAAVPGISPEIVLPGIAPEIVEVVIPEPAEAVIPETVDSPVSIPNGDLYNDGLVQITVNAPEDESYLATLSTWMNLAISYVTGGVQTTNQIV